MISVVIRNKNEASALQKTLSILTANYAHQIDEIIIVDNESTDNSLEIAKSFSCKIVTIKKFTYGKAINLGIENAKNNIVLLLSAHAVPVGTSFFNEAIKVFNSDRKIAGIRIINSFENLERAVLNDFTVKNELDKGLMAACAFINRVVWGELKFNEDLEANEDKEWSKRVVENGYILKEINETYFYFLKRNKNQQLKRWEIETFAEYKLKGKLFPSYLKIIASYLFNISFKMGGLINEHFVINTKMFFKKIQIKRKLENE